MVAIYLTIILVISSFHLVVCQQLSYEANDLSTLNDAIIEIKQIPTYWTLPLNITVDLAAGAFNLDRPLFFQTPLSPLGSSLLLRGAGPGLTLIHCSPKKPKGFVIFGWTTNVSIVGLTFKGCEKGALLLGDSDMEVDINVTNDVPPSAPEAPDLDTNGTDYSVIRNLLDIGEVVDGVVVDDEEYGALDDNRTRYLVEIINCTFESNLGGVVYGDGLAVYLPEDATSDSLFSIQDVHSSYVSVSLLGVEFIYNDLGTNNALNAPALALSRFDLVTLHDCTFSHNNNSQDIVSLQLIETVVVENCSFLENDVSQAANILTIAHASMATVFDSKFASNNVGEDGSVSVLSTIHEITFFNNALELNLVESNTSKGMLRFQDGALLQLSSCDFHGNVISGSKGGVTTSISQIGNVTLWNATFTENKCPSTGALSLFNVSNANLEECYFLRNEGDLRTGGLIVTQSENVRLTGCQMGNNYGGTSGGASFILVLSVIVEGTVVYSNAGGKAGVGGLWVQSAEELGLFNVSLVNNTGEGSHGVGGAILMQVSDIFLFESAIINNSVKGDFAVGGVYIADSPEILIERTAFMRNTNEGGTYSRGALYVGNVSTSMQLMSSSFVDNWADGYFSVGGMYAVSGPSVHIYDCVFTNNTGRSDLSKGAVRLINIKNALVHNSTFKSNVADCTSDNKREAHSAYGQVSGSFDYLMCGGSAIFAYQSKIVILSSLFEYNKGLTLWGLGGAVFMYSSTVHIFASHFNYNSAASGGAVAGVSGSFISIDAPVFTGEPCNEDLEGPDIKQAWPHLFELPEIEFLGGSMFEKNTAMSGGAIAVYESTLATSFFVASKCTTASAVSTTFSRNRALSGGAITSLRNPKGFYVVKANISRNKAFDNIYKLSEDLGGDDGWEVSASTTILAAASLGCAAGNGGGICFSTTWLSGGITQAVADTVFEYNLGQYGGGLYITADELQCLNPDECNLLHITGLQFCGNTTGLNTMTLYAPAPGNVMLEDTEVRFVGNTVKLGAGGGLYLEHVHLAHIQCNDDVSVTLNESYYQPSVCTEDYSHDPLLQKCASWRDNSAVDGYGPHWATTPTSFTMEPVDPAQLTYYASQSKMPFKIRLYDFFENEVKVQAVNPSGSGLTLLTVEVYNCTGCEPVDTMSIEAGARKGTLPIKQSTLEFSFVPGPVNVSVIATVPKLKRALPSMVFPVEVRKCHIGEYTAAEGELCLWCDAGQYQLDPTSTSCSPCPEDAVCIMETTPNAENPIIAPEDGFFNSNPFSSQILECPNQKSCQYQGRMEKIITFQATMLRRNPYDNRSMEAFNQTEYYSVLCSEGYTGPVCGSCSLGYGAVGIGGSCVQCKYNVLLSGLLLFVGALISILPLFFAMHGSLRTARQYMRYGDLRIVRLPHEEEEADQETVLKVLISYFQVIGMLTWIQYTQVQTGVEADLVGGIQGVVDKVIYTANSIVSVRCAGNESTNQQLMAMILSFVIPISGFVLMCLIYGTLEVWRDEVKACRRKVVSWIVPKRWRPDDEGPEAVESSSPSAATIFSSIRTGLQTGNSLIQIGEEGNVKLSSEIGEKSHGKPSPDLETGSTVPTPKMEFGSAGLGARSNYASNHVNLACEQSVVSTGCQTLRNLRITTEKKNMNITTVIYIAGIVSSFVFYPNIVQQTILIFTCYFLDTDGGSELAALYGLNSQKRWVMNLEQVCYTGDHLYVVFFLGIPGTIFSLGAPLGTWCLLFRNVHRFDNADFIGRFSFLYQDYTKKHYYWEAVDMLRKLALSAVLVIQSDQNADPGSQVIATLSFSLFFLILHFACKPFKSPFVHKLEALSQITISATLLYSIFLTYPEIPETYAYITIILGAANLLTIVILGFCWIKSFLDGVLRDAGISPRAVCEMSRQEVGSLIANNEGDDTEDGERSSRLTSFASAGLIQFYKAERAVRNSSQMLGHSLQGALRSRGMAEKEQEMSTKLAVSAQDFKRVVEGAKGRPRSAKRNEEPFRSRPHSDMHSGQEESRCVQESSRGSLRYGGERSGMSYRAGGSMARESVGHSAPIQFGATVSLNGVAGSPTPTPLSMPQPAPRSVYNMEELHGRCQSTIEELNGRH